MRLFLFLAILFMAGCRQPETLNEVSARAAARTAAEVRLGPTLYWNAVSGTKTYRIWKCPIGACPHVDYTVGTVTKPFPLTLAKWQLVAEVPWSSEVLSYPVTCDFEYCVQAVGSAKKIANGGNIVRCGQ